MTKEFEIGLNLIRTVSGQMSSIIETQDSSSVKKVVKSIFNPIVAAAYQIRVGEGPKKEEILNTLISLVKLMRDLEDINGIKVKAKDLLNLVKDVEMELNNATKGNATS